MKELSLTFKLLVIEQIPQEDHTGDCLKEIFYFQALTDRANHWGNWLKDI